MGWLCRLVCSGLYSLRFMKCGLWLVGIVGLCGMFSVISFRLVNSGKVLCLMLLMW